jgi:transcriptional regulator with XRE-family HTH domain
MDDARVGRAIRVLRQRRAWRQVDLAERAGVSDAAISDMERGHVDRYTLAIIRRVLEALDARTELFATWGGYGDLDRALNVEHAVLVEAWAGMHLRAGWEVWPEASYSIYGERGRIDVLSYHRNARVLEVAECKTGIWDLQDTTGRLDVKVRLAPHVARSRGWEAERVVGALVIADGRTARRRVHDFDSTLRGFDIRGRRAAAFIRDPTIPGQAALAFVALPRTTGRRAGQQRVTVRAGRRARSESRHRLPRGPG